MITVPPTTATSSGFEPFRIAGRMNWVSITAVTAERDQRGDTTPARQRDHRHREDPGQQQQRLRPVVIDVLIPVGDRLRVGLYAEHHGWPTLTGIGT